MSHNCKYYDLENGWCKKFSDWHDAMPDIEYCIKGPCPYEEPKTNKIVVDTKYNIGDTVWHYDYYYDAYNPSPAAGKIYKINIDITQNSVHINYHVVVKYKGVKSYEIYPESQCFGSYEECVKWCKEHNNI